MFEHLAWKPIKVGILDFGDGRSFLQKPLAPVNEEFRSQLVKALEEEGFEVVQGDEVIWQNEIAVRNGRMLAAESVDVTLFNFSVWAWPPVRTGGCPVLSAADCHVLERQPQVSRPGWNAGQFRLAGSIRDPLHQELW